MYVMVVYLYILNDCTHGYGTHFSFIAFECAFTSIAMTFRNIIVKIDQMVYIFDSKYIECKCVGGCIKENCEWIWVCVFIKLWKLL